MKRFAIVFTLASLAFAAQPAAAQDTIDPQETYDFIGGSGVGASWGGAQVGPYRGTLLSDPTTPSITLYCVD
jgi:hypothetical protein